MPIRDKICDENIIGDPQASVQTLNGALTMLLRTSYEWRKVCVKVRPLTDSNKCVDVEHPHVRFRDSEQILTFRIRDNKTPSNVRHDDWIERAY
jgi:hypothetical protein